MKKIIVAVFVIGSNSAWACLDMPEGNLCLRKQYAWNCLENKKSEGKDLLTAIKNCDSELRGILAPLFSNETMTDQDVLDVIKSAYDSKKR